LEQPEERDLQREVRSLSDRRAGQRITPERGFAERVTEMLSDGIEGLAEDRVRFVELSSRFHIGSALAAEEHGELRGRGRRLRLRGTEASHELRWRTREDDCSMLEMRARCGERVRDVDRSVVTHVLAEPRGLRQERAAGFG